MDMAASNNSIYSVNVGTLTARGIEKQIKYPVLRDDEDLDHLLRRLEYSSDTEFMLALTFDPELLQRAAVRGIFPMSISVGGIRFCALKVIKSKSKKFNITIDAAFLPVCKDTVKAHGEDWLCGQLRLAFSAIRKTNNKSTRRTDGTPVMRIYSMEAWDADKKLAAGSCYTSLTGFSNISDAGTVLLGAVGVILQHYGFKIWDLGMKMAYKEHMGGHCIPRAEFTKLMSQLCTTDRIMPTIDSSNAVNAYNIINEHSLPPSEFAPATYYV